MEEKLSNLEQVKRDAERLTLRRIRENAEDAGLPVPPRAAHGDRVLPKAKKVEVKVEEPKAEAAENSYKAKVDARGKEYFVGPEGKRVSKAEYDANVNER